jgi:hypothetical protein
VAPQPPELKCVSSGWWRATSQCPTFGLGPHEPAFDKTMFKIIDVIIFSNHAITYHSLSSFLQLYAFANNVYLEFLTAACCTRSRCAARVTWSGGRRAVPQWPLAPHANVGTSSLQATTNFSVYGRFPTNHKLPHMRSCMRNELSNVRVHPRKNEKKSDNKTFVNKSLFTNKYL